MVELGVPLKFRYLISGETYMNGGIATFTYKRFVYYYVNAGGIINAEEALIKFGINAIVGAVSGLAFGYILSLWLRRVVKDDALILNVTISTTFLFAYFTVYGGTGISTGVTLVFLGLFYAGFGKNYLYKSTTMNVELGVNWLAFVLNHFC